MVVCEPMMRERRWRADASQAATATSAHEQQHEQQLRRGQWGTRGDSGDRRLRTCAVGCVHVEWIAGEWTRE